MTQMPWALYLDDIRTPDTLLPFKPESVYANVEYTIARSTEEAKQLVLDRGMPLFMSLDHDLGGDDTAMEFMKWLTREYWDGYQEIPEIKVHSANPIGKANLISFYQSWVKSTID